jgi:hypothetical protein
MKDKGGLPSSLSSTAYWLCRPGCGLQNRPTNLKCFSCGIDAPSNHSPSLSTQSRLYHRRLLTGNPGPEVNFRTPPTHGLIGISHGGGHMGDNSRGGVVFSTFSNWKCGSGGCGEINFATDKSCFSCGDNRVGAVVVVVADDDYLLSMNSSSTYSMGPGSMASTTVLADSSDPSQMDQPSNYSKGSTLMGGSTVDADDDHLYPLGPLLNSGMSSAPIADIPRPRPLAATAGRYESKKHRQGTNEFYFRPAHQASGLGLRVGSRNLVDVKMEFQQLPGIQGEHEQEESTSGLNDDLNGKAEVNSSIQDPKFYLTQL